MRNGSTRWTGQRRRGEVQLCRPRLRLHRLASVVVAAALFSGIAACGDATSTGGGGNASGGGGHTHLVPITLASSAQCNPPTIFNIDFYANSSVCKPNPYFAKNGLAPTYKTVQGSPLVVAGVKSGSITFGPISPATYFAAVAEGAKLKIVQGNYLRFPLETLCTCKTAADLDKGPFATTQVGATDYTGTLGYLRKTGQDALASRIKWVQSGGLGNQLQYMLTGKVAAGTFVLPNAIELLGKDPKLHVVISYKQYEQALPEAGTIIVASNSYIAAHHKVVQELQKSFIEDNRTLHDNPGYAAAIANKLLPHVYTPSQTKDILNIYDATIGVNGGLDASFWQQQVALYNRYFAKKARTVNVPVSSLLDTADMRTTLKELGRVKSTADPGNL